MKDAWLMILIAITVCIVVVGGAAILRRISPPRVMTCADYENFSREHVPARCFGDFHPERQ